MACIRSVGDYLLLETDAAQLWSQGVYFVGNQLGAHYFLGTAMAAVGLSTSLSVLRGVGLKPFFLGSTAALVVGLIGALCASFLIETQVSP